MRVIFVVAWLLSLVAFVPPAKAALLVDPIGPASARVGEPVSFSFFATGSPGAIQYFGVLVAGSGPEVVVPALTLSPGFSPTLNPVGGIAGLNLEGVSGEIIPLFSGTFTPLIPGEYVVRLSQATGNPQLSFQTTQGPVVAEFRPYTITVVIPEPTTLGLIVAAGLTLLRRR